MSKHTRKRIELTPSQIARLDAAAEALDEILIAYEAANGERDSIELTLTAKRDADILGSQYPWPRLTKTWWHAGDYFDGRGSGKTLAAALDEHFRANDATEKRKSAERCRIHAEALEREAKEIEEANAKASA